MPGYRDRVDVLWPATKSDKYTEAPIDDWDAEPLRTVPDVRATVQPLSSQERTVTEETVITRWNCFIRPESIPADLELTTRCRIRWDGDVFSIAGDVGRWKTGRRVRQLQVVLKRVS